MEQTEELFPGNRVTRRGGHTAGQLMTEVSGHSKHVVLASDATYFYEEFEADRPFWLCCDLLATYRSLDLFRELDRRGRLDRARPGGGRNEASVGRWPGWRGDHRADGPLAYNAQPDSCGAAGRFPINDPSTSRRGRSNESCCCSAGLARPDGSSGAGSVDQPAQRLIGTNPGGRLSVGGQRAWGLAQVTAR